MSLRASPGPMDDVDEAIGYALLETDHLPGMARKGPAFRENLLEAGWVLVRDPGSRQVTRSDGGRPAASVIRCVRCGRALQNVFKLNGAPFGRVCVMKA